MAPRKIRIKPSQETKEDNEGVITTHNHTLLFADAITSSITSVKAKQ
jgi:hypothetical protein